MDRRTALKSCLGVFGTFLGSKSVGASQIVIPPGVERHTRCLCVPTSLGFISKVQFAYDLKREKPRLYYYPVAQHIKHGDGNWRVWINLQLPDVQEKWEVMTRSRNFRRIQDPIAWLGPTVEEIQVIDARDAGILTDACS